MKGVGNAKLILLQPSIHKSFGSHHRLCLIAIISFFTFASLLALLASAPPKPPNPNRTLIKASSVSPKIHDALLHYAAASGAGAGGMAAGDLRAIAAVVRRHAPCNLLVFGLGFESLLWRALNANGRTVFLDESEYYIKHFEERHPGIEAYDVAYTTKVSEMRELVAYANAQVKDECRPVQNLLFSDCRLGINDLPNELYQVNWDVILVDGPRGYSEMSPGRMAAIFTAAVMARSGGKGKTDVLVHDVEREVERACSEEFLCGENLVGVYGQLAHFVIRGGEKREGFCANRSVSLPPVTVAKAL